MSKVVLSTYLGIIPYLRSINDKYDIKIYLDDLIFQDSMLIDKDEVELNDFMNVTNTIHIDVKNKVKIVTKSGKKDYLVSKKGNFFYNKEMYDKLCDRFKNINIFDYDTKELTINDKKFVEPDSLDDFITKFNTFDGYIGTEFMSDLVEKGKLIFLESTSLTIKPLEECKDKDYIKYMFKLNEINAKIHICEHNFDQLFKYINK